MNTMLRRAALALVALSVSLSAAPARKHLPRPQPRVLVAAPAIARPPLWKVADSDTTIYLFGTIHVLPKGINWFDGKVAGAFNGSQELVTEIVESDGSQLQAAVLAKAMMPANATLRSLMGADERTRFEAAMKVSGLPVDAMDKFKPWFAAVNLAALPILKEGYDPANGVEKALDTRARALSHPHSALETAEFQLGLFDGLPQDLQLRYLAEVVKTMPDAKNEIAGMVEAWKRGDAESLAQIMNEGEDEPALMEKLLFARNRTWAEWIKARMDRPGVVFLAVGAGHLAGDGSVQRLLAAKGIVSSRVQ
jgi:uncharacterized protein YbaP (TraB family)